MDRDRELCTKAATSGNVTDEVVAKYIELQGELPEDDESFRVSE